MADKVAPYFNAKLAPLIVEPPAEPEEAKAKRLYDAMRQMRGTIATQPHTGQREPTLALRQAENLLA